MGAKPIAFVGSTMQENGICDRYICHPIFRGWVEFKRNHRKVEPLQHDFIRDMKSCKDVAMVCRLVDQGDVTTIYFENEIAFPFYSLELDDLFKLCENDAQRGKMLLEALHDAWEMMQ